MVTANRINQDCRDNAYDPLQEIPVWLKYHLTWSMFWQRASEKKVCPPLLMCPTNDLGRLTFAQWRVALVNADRNVEGRTVFECLAFARRVLDPTYFFVGLGRSFTVLGSHFGLESSTHTDLNGNVVRVELLTEGK